MAPEKSSQKCLLRAKNDRKLPEATQEAQRCFEFLRQDLNHRHYNPDIGGGSIGTDGREMTVDKEINDALTEFIHGKVKDPGDLKVLRTFNWTGEPYLWIVSPSFFAAVIEKKQQFIDKHRDDNTAEAQRFFE